MTTLYQECTTPKKASELFLDNGKPVALWINAEFGCVNIKLDTETSIDKALIKDVEPMPFPLLNELVTYLQAEALMALFTLLKKDGGIDFSLDRSGFNHTANTMVFHHRDLGIYLSLCRTPPTLNS